MKRWTFSINYVPLALAVVAGAAIPFGAPWGIAAVLVAGCIEARKELPASKDEGRTG